MKFSSDWLRSYEARHNIKQAFKPTPSAVERESELHEQIMAECRRRGWVYCHGSMAHATHRTPGEADFIIFGSSQNTPRVYVVECKTATGKLSDDQLAFKAGIERYGHTLHVVRSFEEFLGIL